MRCAILAVSSQGASLARRVCAALDEEADIYVNEKYMAAAPEGAKPFWRLSEYVAEIFHRYDALIFIAAAGIAVRMIAPHLAGKLEDPAVLVMDERGKHVISLLSGHMGGANLLARQLAESLGAVAVITTATDVEGLLAPDLLAAGLALRPWPKERIEQMNSALLRGEDIGYYVEASLAHAEFYREKLQEQGIPAALVRREELPEQGLRVFVTGRAGDGLPGLLYLLPRRLVAGVGCRKGTSEELVRAALEAACRRIGRDLSFIDLLATSEVKREEEGLLSVARTLGRDIRFFGKDALQRQVDAYHLRESSFVRKQIGVGNVCEAAALACVPAGRFALPKTKYEKVTVALLWEK